MPIRTVLSVTCPEACSEPLPGGMIGPTKRTTRGVAISEETIQIRPKRRAWLGSGGAGPGSAAIASSPPPVSSPTPPLHHVQEPVHVAERLHRPALPEDPSRRAGHEALPAVAALLSGPESEGDRAVRLRCRAGREFALVLGFFGHARQRDEQSQLGHGECVGGFFGVDAARWLAVDRDRTCGRALDLGEEGIAQPRVAVELVDGD